MSEKLRPSGNGDPEVRAEAELDVAGLRRRGSTAIDRYWAAQFVDLVEEEIRPLPDDKDAPQGRHYFPGGSVAMGPNYVKHRNTGNETDEQEKK